MIGKKIDSKCTKGTYRVTLFNDKYDYKQYSFHLFHNYPVNIGIFILCLQTSLLWYNSSKLSTRYNGASNNCSQKRPQRKDPEA